VVNHSSNNADSADASDAIRLKEIRNVNFRLFARKTQIRRTIGEMIKAATSYEDFIKRMRELGYEIERIGKQIEGAKADADLLQIRRRIHLKTQSCTYNPRASEAAVINWGWRNPKDYDKIVAVVADSRRESVILLVNLWLIDGGRSARSGKERE